MIRETKFSITQDSSSLNIILSSTLENIDRVAGLTRRFLDDRGYDTLSFATRLVLREGLTNAVKHAHRCDPSKLIKYRLKLQGKALFMEIEDEGEGFDWRCLSSGSPEEKAEHGRGMMIMKHYFTECRYNDAGNKLILIKDIE